MGLADRDYTRNRPAGPGGLGPRFGPRMGLSATGWLIAINVVVFVLTVGAGPLGAWLWQWGHFSTARAFFERVPAPDGSVRTILFLEVWRFITFQFLHANVLHIAMNMLGLWVFGRAVEERLGPRRYLAFYLVCGVFGAVLFVLLNLLGQVLPGVPGVLVDNPQTPLIGASAGVFGVIMACAYLIPNEQVVLLFPPIPVRIKVFAYFYVGLAVVLLVTGSRNAGGEAAHLGGAIAGFFFIRNTHLLRDFFDVFARSDKAGRTGPSGRTAAGARPRGRARSGPKPLPESEVDRILDKIRDEGTGALTPAERRRLARASRSEDEKA